MMLNKKIIIVLVTVLVGIEIIVIKMNVSREFLFLGNLGLAVIISVFATFVHRENKTFYKKTLIHTVGLTVFFVALLTVVIGKTLYPIFFDKNTWLFSNILIGGGVASIIASVIAILIKQH